MKCNRCLLNMRTVSDVLNCNTCRKDGTANEVPKSLPRVTALEEAVRLKPGLLKRFQADVVVETPMQEIPPSPWPFPKVFKKDKAKKKKAAAK